MNKYIATFGCGQKYEGYYVEIVTDKYSNAIEYMESQYDGEYCMVYDENYWNEWVEKANKEGFMVEEILDTVNI